MRFIYDEVFPVVFRQIFAILHDEFASSGR